MSFNVLIKKAQTDRSPSQGKGAKEKEGGERTDLAQRGLVSISSYIHLLSMLNYKNKVSARVGSPSKVQLDVKCLRLTLSCYRERKSERKAKKKKEIEKKDFVLHILYIFSKAIL